MAFEISGNFIEHTVLSMNGSEEQGYEAMELSDGKVLLVVRGGKQLILLPDGASFQEFLQDEEELASQYNDLRWRKRNDMVNGVMYRKQLAEWLTNAMYYREQMDADNKITLRIRYHINAAQTALGKPITVFPEPITDNQEY